MYKKIAYTIFLLFSIGLILINIPIEDLAYGVNEYKKNVFIFYLTGVGILFFLFTLFLRKKETFKYNYIDIILLLIFVYNSVRVLFERDYQIKKIFILWVSIFFYFFYKQSIQQLDNKKLIQRTIFFITAACFLFQLLIGTFQLIGLYPSYNNFFQITGTFENPGPYAIFLSSTFAFLVTFYLLTFQTKLLTRVFFIPACIIILCFLTMILSRSALVGFIISFYLLTYVNSIFCFFSRTSLKNIRYGIIALFIGIFCITYFVKKDSADGRIVIWKVSERIVKTNPILGIGFNRLSIEYNLYQSEYFKNNPKKEISEGFYVDNTKVIFNDFYQILCEQGIIGFIMILLLVYYLAIEWHKFSNSFTKSDIDDKPNILVVSSLHGIIVLFCSGLFDDVLEQFPLQILFYFYLAVISALQINNSSYNIKRQRSEYNFKFVNLVNIFILIFMFYKTYHLHVILKNIKTDIVSNTINKPIYNLPLDNDYYIINKSESLLINVPSEDAIQFLENSKKYSSHWKLYVNLGIVYRERKDYKNAELNLLIAHNMIPHLLYPKFLLAKVYLESKEMEKWKEMANRILREKEKVPSEKVDGMRKEIKELLKNSKGD